MSLNETEREVMQRENARKMRAAQHDVQTQDHFERMKRLVITEK